MTLAPGTHLHSYEIRSPLGAGGMGEAYRDEIDEALTEPAESAAAEVSLVVEILVHPPILMALVIWLPI